MLKSVMQPAKNENASVNISKHLYLCILNTNSTVVWLFLLQKRFRMNCFKYLTVCVLLLVVNGIFGLPSYCKSYYSEFSLNENYNPTIYPEVKTKITDITTLYKVSEVIQQRIPFKLLFILFEYSYIFLWVQMIQDHNNLNF